MKKRGFTLVEIAVVVGLLGLLAGLCTPMVLKSIRSSKIKTAQAELEMISAAVLQMAWDCGKWPNGSSRTLNGWREKWDLSDDACGLMGNDGRYTDWKGPYYDGEIKDPWGNNYFFDPDYRRDGVHVVVGSFGPNGIGRNRYDSDDVYILLDD